MLRARRRPEAVVLVPLPDAVRGVAACPCDRHQNSFVAALAHVDELLLRVASSTGPLPADGGRYVVGEGEEIEVGTAVDAEGHSFLQAFTDLDAATAAHQGACFVGVDAQAAFRIAISRGNEGLLVTAGGEDDAWAAVSRDAIAWLVAGASDPNLACKGLLRRVRAISGR